MNNQTFFGRVKAFIRRHKIWSTIIVLVVLGIAYKVYASVKAGNVTPQYVIARARIGTISQQVTGSGQVSASNQLDVKSQVSGTILTIPVAVGTYVKKGQILATIDSTNAALDLQNAKISYSKLVQPAKASDITNSTNSLIKSYDDAFNAAASVYTDAPAIMAGLKDLLYGQTGFLSDQRSTSMTPPARAYRDAAGAAYDKALLSYQKTFQEYKATTRNCATSTLDTLFSDTANTAKQIADAVKSTQSSITYLASYQPDYDPTGLNSARNSVNTWANTVNGDLSSLVSAQNNIVGNQNSLNTLVQGADALDIQSAQISLTQKQQAYDDYFIRAPFDGVVGRIPVNVYDQASASTVIATVVGLQKIASISLNEVDAAKVQVGQPVKVTFDAIDNLTATGTVSVVDQVGTVTSGVVSYGVKIVINTADDRIKPGMSVNVTIMTKVVPDVLIVPSSAVKTALGQSYVEVLDVASSSMNFAGMNGTTGTRTASTTRAFRNGSVNGGTQGGSSTYSGTFTGGSGTNGITFSTNGTMTISSSIAPHRVTVVVGDSDDTNTQIVSGLSRGQAVVTKTVSGSAGATAAAPSILSSFGGNRGGAAGRTTTVTRPPGN